MEYYEMFFVPCLIVGSIFVIAGLIKFRDPFKAKKMFFWGGVSFLAPVILLLTVFMIEAINILIDEQCDHIPYTMTLIEILLTAALLLSYFGHPEDLDARNSTLGWSIVLFLQALFWTIIVLG